MIILGIYLYSYQEQKVVDSLVRVDRSHYEVMLEESEVVNIIKKWYETRNGYNDTFTDLIIAKTKSGMFCASIDKSGRLFLNKQSSKVYNENRMLCEIADYRNRMKLW